MRPLTDERLIRALEELVAWTKVQAIPAARKALESALTKPEHRAVYQASDGASSTEVAKRTKVSDFTVRAVWKRTSKLGLMLETKPSSGRFKRAFDLEDFDLWPDAKEEK